MYWLKTRSDTTEVRIENWEENLKKFSRMPLEDNKMKNIKKNVRMRRVNFIYNRCYVKREYRE